MSKLTARELLTDFDITDFKHEELARRVEAVLALHRPYGIYDECGHEHTDEDVEAGRAHEIEDVGRTCEEGLLYRVCYTCHLSPDGEPVEWTDDCEWPCLTVRALDGEEAQK